MLPLTPAIIIEPLDSSCARPAGPAALVENVAAPPESSLMPARTNPADVARELRASLTASGRASRRMRSFTFWRMFGVLRRTAANVRRVVDALATEGLTAGAAGHDLGREGRLTWLTIRVAEPVRPAAQARSGCFPANGFASRHPALFSLILLGSCGMIATGNFGTLIVTGFLTWSAQAALRYAPRLAKRLPSLNGALDWADRHRIEVALTSAVSFVTVIALGGMLSRREPVTDQPLRRAPIAAPENPTDLPTATYPPPPPTATPVPVPPTPRPPIDTDPNRDQVCENFPNYGTMKAWRDYWQARGVRNPGRLDGDGDGLACEEGEGGRPAPPRPPTAPPPPRAPAPLYQAPAPPPSGGGGGGGGGGGCCKYCNPGKSKPCGNSCISLSKNCHQPPGCACSGGG